MVRHPLPRKPVRTGSQAGTNWLCIRARPSVVPSISCASAPSIAAAAALSLLDKPFRAIALKADSPSPVVTTGSRWRILTAPKFPASRDHVACPRLACAAGVSNGSWVRGSAQCGASSSFRPFAFLAAMRDPSPPSPSSQVPPYRSHLRFSLPLLPQIYILKK
jgi:hypothetical protein